jgi:molecular chaperone GrpE
MEDRKINTSPKDVNNESETVESEEAKGMETEGQEPDIEKKTDDISQLKSTLEEKSKLCEDYFNRLQKLQADFENYKRRSLIEREEIVKYANEELVMKLLEILDSFDSAVNGLEDRFFQSRSKSRTEHKKRDAHQNKESTGEALNTLYDGIKMIHKQLYNTLEGEGVEVIKTKDERFDPFRHEALSRIYRPELDENSIVEEVQKGYIFKSRVIRTAKVIVSTKEAPPEAKKGDV